MHFKTNASWRQIYDIIKHYKLSYTDDLYKGIEQDTPAANILAHEITTPKPNWDLELTEEEITLMNIKRYPPNPEPNWGPKKRAQNAPTKQSE